jgi:hypothetical protein
MCEEIVHLLERQSSCLGQKKPEEDGISEVADLSERKCQH